MGELNLALFPDPFHFRQYSTPLTLKFGMSGFSFLVGLAIYRYRSTFQRMLLGN